jgi:hypothetical protein
MVAGEAFYSNGKGCKRHKGTATRWSGCPAAHLRYHHLKRGVTNYSALNLIRRSFTPQAFWDALQATFKDGKVVSAAQAEMQDELEDVKRNAPWVDITQGMETSERLEYDLEARGRITLLDLSNPEALNFNEEQSFKSFGTAGTNASMYTSTQSVSLGGTAFEPQDDGEVDSQESSIFDCSDNPRAEEDIEDDTEGAFIENMGAFGLGSTRAPSPHDAQEEGEDGMEVELDAMGLTSQVHSPVKVTRVASIRSGFSAEVTDSHCKDVQEMIQQWINKNGNHDIPLHLADLAARARVELKTLSTPHRRDK